MVYMLYIPDYSTSVSPMHTISVRYMSIFLPRVLFMLCISSKYTNICYIYEYVSS